MEDNFEKSKPPAQTETPILPGKWRDNWDLRIEHGGDPREYDLKRETELRVSLDIGIGSSSPIGKSADHESLGSFYR